MQIIERASVRSRKKDLYYISITKNAKCDGCKACGFGRKNRLTMPALSLIECNAGDTVCVRMPEKQVKASYVYLYLLPLLFMFAGLMIPYAYGEIYMLIGAGVGLAVSVPVSPFTVCAWLLRSLPCTFVGGPPALPTTHKTFGVPTDTFAPPLI